MLQECYKQYLYILYGYIRKQIEKNIQIQLITKYL